jgi:hypothetical protein
MENKNTEAKQDDTQDAGIKDGCLKTDRVYLHLSFRT